MMIVSYSILLVVEQDNLEIAFIFNFGLAVTLFSFIIADLPLLVIVVLWLISVLGHFFMSKLILI